MQHPPGARGLRLALSACLAATAATVTLAQPSAEEMVEMLRKPAAPEAVAALPRTRSLRTLQVEAVKPGEGPAATDAKRPQVTLDVQFDFDSASVRPESRRVLDNLAQALQSSELAAAHFAVEGHTDARGRDDYNLRLSQLRADAVRDYLARRGVAAERLMPVGKGSQEPANATDSFAAENRRVRILNLQ